MKKHLIIAGIICAATIPPATAVTKCINLTSTTTCGFLKGTGADWSSYCSGITVQGVAVCGSQSAQYATKSDAVTTSSASDSNKYCWCKMVSPAVSRWVSGGEFESSSDCDYNCAYKCGMGVGATDNTFTAAIFSELGD